MKRLKKEVTPKTSKPKAARKGAAHRGERDIVVKSQILLPIVLQADLHSIRARGDTLSLERLEKLDLTLKKLNGLTDEALDGFRAYSATHIQEVTIREVSRRKPRRVGRERRPARFSVRQTILGHASAIAASRRGSSAAAGPSGPAVATTLTACCRVQASAGLRAFRRLLHALRIGRYLDTCAFLLE